MLNSDKKSYPIVGRVIESVVQDIEPMVLKTSMPFGTPVNNIGFEIQDMLESFSEQVCREIKNHKHRPVIPIKRYSKTAHAAAYLDVDPTFLTQRQGSTFVEGIHYFKPNDSSILRWDLEKLEEWMRTVPEGESHDDILDKMFA